MSRRTQRFECCPREGDLTAGTGGDACGDEFVEAGDHGLVLGDGSFLKCSVHAAVHQVYVGAVDRGETTELLGDCFCPEPSSSRRYDRVPTWCLAEAKLDRSELDRLLLE